MANDHHVGSRIRALRRARGYTQSQLADLLGQSPSSIAMYENGRREPDLDTLSALARALGTTRTAILSDEAETDPSPAPEPDDEIWAIRESLRRNPEMRTLFSLSKNATPEQLRQTIAIIEALKRTSEPNDE